MGRLLLIVLAGLLAVTFPASAAPVRSISGQSYENSEAVKAYLEGLAAEDRAEEAGREAAKADEALRKEKAAEIQAHNREVDAWLKAHPAPEGTRDTLVHETYDEAYNVESTELIYVNRWEIPTHTQTLGPGGQAGLLVQTQPGKAWETIGPKVSPGQPPELNFGEDDNGETTITSADIPSADGKRTIARYEFNEDGIAWRGETFDPETGQRTGGFQDDRLKPKPKTLGGPLDVPATVRLITGVCEQCRPLANAHNDLASEINRRVAEMQALSVQHQHAYPRQQKEIRARYEVLKAEVTALMPQFEAARAKVLACEKNCPKPPPQQPDNVLKGADPTLEGPTESILDSIEETNPYAPRESILDDIDEPQPPPRTVREPDIQPTKDAYPATDEDLEKVVAAAQAYLAAANCEGMKCPKIDCAEARRALQALIDMEAYVKQMVFYSERADEDHMAHLRALAESNILNGQQRDLLIRVIAIQEFYQNFGSMLLDIASVGSWAKGLATNPKSLDQLSPAEALDRLNDLYQASKDLESLVATVPSSGKPASTGIADAVDVAGGVDKDFINNTTSTITDLKSIAVDARTIIEEAQKNGKDWRQELKGSGIFSAVGQITGRYLKAWSQKNLEERQQRLNDLLRDAEAGDVVQAQAYIDLQRAQRRRWAAVDALAALQSARDAYSGCVSRICGPMSFAGPVIPEFQHVVAGTTTTKYDWGAALRWLNGAIAQTLPKMRPVACTDDCPKDETRADPGQPQTFVAVRSPEVVALPPGAVRPQFERVNLTLPASFCSEFERNDFLNNVYNPAAAAALRNATSAQQYAATLNGLFTQYMRNEGGPIWAAIQREMAEWKPIAADAQVKAEGMPAVYTQILAIPIADCPQTADNSDVGAIPATGQPLTPVNDTPTTPKPGKPDCPPEDRRKPISVGPNSKVGSGARLKAKAASTAMGIAGGLLGGALPGGGGGGGGGSGGPPTVVCKIKDSEMTVFTDPVTGVSLKVGAKRAGGTVVVFADIARSPDNGTFQTAFLENPQGQAMAPAEVGICDMWGEWKLTVSWTKDTYVDGELVKHEAGGWSEMGKFAIPGVLSTVNKPDGLWKRLGFSNASHGARKIALQYKVPAGGGPIDAIIHITRPSTDPVTTVPFALHMVEGPNGFAFTEAPKVDCPPGPAVTQVRTDPIPTPPVVASNPPPPETSTPPPGTQVRELEPVEDLYKLERDIDIDAGIDRATHRRLSRPQCTRIERSNWSEDRDEWVWHMQRRLAKWRGMKPAGPLADGVREALAAETARLQEDIKNAREMTMPSCRKEDPPPPPAAEPEGTPSILDSIEEVPVIS